MDLLNELEQNLIHVKSVDEDPDPIAQTLKYMSLLYDLATKESETLSQPLIEEMEKRIWQLIVVYQSQLKFSFFHLKKKHTLSLNLFLILSRLIILRHRGKPESENKTCSMISSLDPDLYLPKLVDKRIATFTLKECVDSITVLGTGFVQKHFHLAMAQYLSLLSYRLSEFCHFMMPYEEFQDVDFCNLVEQDDQSMGIVTFEFIQRVYVILYQMYYHLQAVYIRQMCRPVATPTTLISNLRDMVTEQVGKLVSAESGKTMRQKYISSQMRPGEREMFMLSTVKKTGYEDDQQIFLHFRGEAEFSRMFEYCQKPWSEIIKDEIETFGGDESIGMQMCLFDLLCMMTKNQKVPRTDLHRFMIWEADIPKKFQELLAEQNETPFMVQVFNGIQLVYRNKMYMYNSLVLSFIKWVDLMANPPDEEDDVDLEEEMELDVMPKSIVKNLSEQVLWNQVCEGQKETSVAHRRPPPKGYVAFRL